MKEVSCTVTLHETRVLQNTLKTNLKTKNLATKPHTDTRIRIKLLGSETCPTSSVDLSPAAQEPTLVQEFAEVPPWKGRERDAVSARGGRAHGEQLCGEQQPWRALTDPTSSRCRCLQTNGTRGCPNCRRLSVKPGYV